MKWRQLMLKAFGPFTNTTLDFSGPANLHLIYGPNEAGKSSALRAMADLRYGVPARSTDGFLHGSTQLRLAATLEDAAGQLVCLARRKGNKDTLLYADPRTGDAIAGSLVGPDVLLALTGGVTREQFASMYGLDSAHLRSGGEQLIRGEGELGAALFEASTGSAGIKATLEALAADAKKFHTARGSSSVLAEASRNIDEARHRYKHALTRPDQWKTLQRAHDEAKAQLVSVKTQLVQQRRQLAELSQWRSVEPVLRDLDLATQAWHAVQHHKDLPSTAREERLAALQQQAHANDVLQESGELIAQVQAEWATLPMNPALLAHQGAIERLGVELAGVRRDATARQRLATQVASQAQQLALQASRLTGDAAPSPDLDALFRALPSEADQATLQGLVNHHEGLTRSLQHAQTQRRHAADKLRQLQGETLRHTEPALQQGVVLAVAQAHALGETQQRGQDLAQAVSAAQARLGAALAELGWDSRAQLSGWRCLPDSEIDAFESAQADLCRALDAGTQQLAQWEADLATQQSRFSSLAASGELVSAATLRGARQQRELDWQAVRAVFIDCTVPPGADAAGADVPASFERAQAEADRQADLLRAGAQRAAEVAECEQRIHEMTQAQAQHLEAQAQAQHQTRLAQLQAAWQQTLQACGLGPSDARQARAGVARQKAAVDALERLNAAEQAQQQFVQQVTQTGDALRQALCALGMGLPASPQALPVLLALGVQCQSDLVAAQAHLTRHQRDMAQVSHEHQQANDTFLAVQAQASTARQALDAACLRLHLAAGASAEAITARLGELQRWAREYQAHAANLLQWQQLNACELSLQVAAQALAAQLEAPLEQSLDVWFDALSLSLLQAQRAQARAATLQERDKSESLRHQRAQQTLAHATQVLAQLMTQAEVTGLESLALAETKAQERQDAAKLLASLTRQLSQMSAHDPATLRADLAGRDRVALEAEIQACEATIADMENQELQAIAAEQAARVAVAAIDTSDAAAQAREDMEAAVARYRAGVRPWAQLKLAHALLTEALRRYRERAQGPLIQLAGDYLSAMTAGRFIGLWVDEDESSPVLKVRPAQGAPLAMAGLSEGTADQLYLALRLAALQVQRQPERMMPLVLDDVLMTADDDRAHHMLQALARFSEQGQVVVFTHHRHLVDIAQRSVGADRLRVHQLPQAFERVS